jgi:hypothetical protein
VPAFHPRAAGVSRSAAHPTMAGIMQDGVRQARNSFLSVAWCLGMATLACGGSSAPGPGAAADASAAIAPDAGGSAGMSDKDYCDRACTTLIGCGVQYDAGCSAGCVQSVAFLACAKSSANECNALALCAFRQASAGLCGGGTAGVPSGTGTCGKAAECEYLCGSQNAGPACSCACWAALAPAKAINLLINNQCAVATCAVPCGPGGNGPACNACFTSGACGAQNAQCTSR